MSICSLFNFLKIHNWFLLQDPLTYSISYNPPASLYFNIDSTSGLIRTATTLYQDEADRYVVCQLEVFFLEVSVMNMFYHGVIQTFRQTIHHLHEIKTEYLLLKY